MVKADEPLQFRKLARFRTGEVAQTELVYEKLPKVCFLCKRLTHDQKICPFHLPIEVHHSQERKLRKPGDKAQEKRKGKGVLTSGRDQQQRRSRQRGNTRQEDKEPERRGRSVKERLQWNDGQGRRNAADERMEWRQAQKADTSGSGGESLKTSGESSQTLGNKRRLHSSAEKEKKEEKSGSSKKTRTSPSVFERLGSSGERQKNKRRVGDEVEKENLGQTPLVFERLRSQSSRVDSRSPKGSCCSDHSAEMAAQGSSHSVSMTTNQDNHSAKIAEKHQVQVVGEGISDRGCSLKEGLIINSNPSSS